MRGFCDHPGCKDLAEFRPTILVTSLRNPDVARRGGDVFAAAIVGEDAYCVRYCVVLDFCRGHSGTFQPRQFMDEACWSAIENQLRQRGFAPPDKDGLEVEWEPSAGSVGLDPESEHRMLARLTGDYPRKDFANLGAFEQHRLVAHQRLCRALLL